MIFLPQTTLTDPFWNARQKPFLENGLRHQWQMCQETGRLENFRRVALGQTGGHQGYYYNDSDVYKLLEAMIYGLHASPNLTPVLHLVEEAVDLIEGAVQEDGYINTFITLGKPDRRYARLASEHELYCMGHLLEACAAAGESCPKEAWAKRLVSVGHKVVDHLVATFGPGQVKGYCGHQELEMALVRFGKLSRRSDALSLGRWMIEERGSRPSPFEASLTDPSSPSFDQTYFDRCFVTGQYDGQYCQDHVPLREMDQIVGHAVRACYFFSGALDSFGDSDPALKKALKAVWQNLTESRMYITGGIGSTAANEGFTSDYDLPNRSAYAETCAGISLVMWGARMGSLFEDVHYWEVAEKSLYNGVLSGVNLGGDLYNYVNPLECYGDHTRQPWFACACCPPNIARMILSVQRYAGDWNDARFLLGLLIGGSYRSPDGMGAWNVEGDSATGKEFAFTPEGVLPQGLLIRIPSWASSARGKVAGEVFSLEPGSFWRIERNWDPGERVELELGIKPKVWDSHPSVWENQGRIAFSHGPFVHCFEEFDLGFAPQEMAVSQGPISMSGSFEGVPRLQVFGVRAGRASNALYGSPLDRSLTEVTASSLPYAFWDNRGKNRMQIWVRER
ncbi:MAG: glycoside hydrolase family 127 protein [Fimbriimonadaceae bacterium]|jgi:hypothetical protein|nr:glycoside hydrolase family 127 protein [Fimbriimonadaceae bacterium]